MRLGTHKFSLLGLCLAAAPPLCVGAVSVWIRIKHPDFVEQYKDIFVPVATTAGVMATIISALVIASFTAEANTRNAKVKAAWDALAKKQWDKDYLEARETFVTLQRSDAAFSKYASRTAEQTEKFVVEFKAVLNIANDYEIMAIGIEHHVLDETVIRDSFRAAWIDDYQTLLPFFDEIRDQTGNPGYFRTFGKYATKWRKMRDAEVAKRAS